MHSKTCLADWDHYTRKVGKGGRRRQTTQTLHHKLLEQNGGTVERGGAGMANDGWKNGLEERRREDGMGWDGRNS